MTDAPPRQWHRNPVAWLMIAIPAATVVAGFWTLWLAASESGVDSHPDKVRRTAQVQVTSLAPDEAAARLGLSAELVVGADGVLVQVLPASGPVAPRLQLVHPIESSLDRELVLSPHPRGWQSPGPLVGKEAWHLRLVAADGSWRLVGRYRPGDTAVRLEPAVSAE
ncbi:MAG TPA: FixH family protein [Arenimonas sp.]|uniref:FixH family protein n=1 Tax=Arenimonas sp. TaxID=1872635 RepID=UPI002D7E90AA|nr:FixH family protein [Arenimonas sp.]HEU0153055.1 FixH family protein [Arenimonas sp.]